MKMKIYVLLLCLAVILSFVGCADKASPIAGTEGPSSAATDGSGESTIDDGGIAASQSIDPGTYMGSIADVEYAFILWSFRDQVVSNLTYTLRDQDGDGQNELLINAVTDLVNGMYTQFLADSNGTGFYYWGYTPTGAAQSSSFCTMEGYDTLLWNESYSTMDYAESHYKSWTGKAWEEISALDGLEFDYGNAATLDSPNLLNIGLTGEPGTIFADIDAYFAARSDSQSVGQADLDGDGQEERIYCVFSAADEWYDCLQMENTSDNQSFTDHQDIYMTVVIADEKADGVILRPVRIQYRGSTIEIRENALFINDTSYVYTDTNSQYTSPCLQTSLSSPGTYGDFDSLGTRTVLGMRSMPYGDVSKVCTGITFYEADARSVSATLGASRCDFDFIILPDEGGITAASPAYKVEVASWNLITGGMSIDPIPVIGDFYMGDPISELRELMVPSTEWFPLYAGQDFLVHTDFYYRPTYENDRVYHVDVWTDGTGEDSRVTAICLEEVYELDDDVKAALGLS